MLNFYAHKQEHSKVQYTFEEFIFRIKKLEKLCNKENLDSILLVTGVDSRDNCESTKLFNWLFRGLYGVQMEQDEFLDYTYQEFIFQIFKDGHVQMYVEPPMYEDIKGLVLGLTNAQIFCPNQKQYENKDELELIKISQFMKMVKDVEKIGFVLGKKDLNKVSNVEKWPIIQSYGQAELGLGFFSLSHKVFDLTASINRIYKNHDANSLKNLMEHTSERLASHVYSSYLKIEDAKWTKKKLITEIDLSDLVKDVYEMAEEGKFIRKLSQELQKPMILFGVNTGKSQEPSSDNIWKASHVEGESAIHSTVECVDVYSKMRAARTYFMRPNVLEEYYLENVMDSQNQVYGEKLVGYLLKSNQNKLLRDEQVLLSTYINLIKTFYKCLNGFSQNFKNMNVDFIYEQIQANVNPAYQNLTQKQISPNQVSIILKSYNSFGEENEINFKETVNFKLTPCIYVLRIKINQIESVIYPKKDMGGVLFCETFIFQESCFQLLTNNIRYLDVFQMNEQYSENFALKKKAVDIDQLGQHLTSPCEKNLIFLPNQDLAQYQIEMPILKSNIQLFQQGLMLYDDKLGYKLVLFKNVIQVDILLRLEHPWIIIEQTDKLYLEHTHVQMICIELGSQAYTQILLKLKEILVEKEIQHKYIEEVPSFMVNSYELRKYVQNIPKANSFCSELIYNSQIQDRRFLNQYIETKQLVILNKMQDLKISQYASIQSPFKEQSSQDLIKVYILNGSYCTGKTRFAEKLMKFGPQCQTDLQMFAIQMKNFHELTCEKYLNELMAKINSLKQSQSLIIVIPNGIDINQICQSQAFIQKCQIQCVVTKININNFYENANKQPSQQVLTYALKGYSQFILVDSYAQEEKKIDEFVKIIRTLLPNSSITRIINNILRQDLALEILKFNQYHSPVQQLERIKYITLYHYQTKPFQWLFIPFKFPIIKQQLTKVIFKELMQKRQGLLASFENKDLDQEDKKAKRSKDSMAIEIALLKRKMFELNMQNDKDSLIIKYIKGVVRFEGELEKGVYDITINGNYFLEREVKDVKAVVRKTNLKGLEVQKVFYDNEKINEELGFLFCGFNLDSQKLQQYLYENIIQSLKPKVPLITRNDLSEETIKQIEIENADVYLEHGQFFDGNKFRDEDGKMLPQHPQRDQLIEKYLLNENSRIGQINRGIEKEWKLIESMYD